jgi:hypothetical protein
VSCWEAGWWVSKAEGSWAFVSNGRVQLFIDDREQLAPAGASVGQPVRLWLPCARENLSPGFFYLVGRAGPIDRQAPHHKLYLNLAPEAAAPLVTALLHTARLSRLRVEARLANSPAGYCRADTALLCVGVSDYPALLAWVRSWRRTNPHWFRPGTPLFTRGLGQGLGVAQAAPGHPLDSFGLVRCQWMAEELRGALEAGENRPQQWAKRIGRRFEREGFPLPPSDRRSPSR